MELADKKCSDGVSVPPLKVLRERELLKELGQGWTLNGRGHLMRLYTQKVVFVEQAKGYVKVLEKSTSRFSTMRGVFEHRAQNA